MLLISDARCKRSWPYVLFALMAFGPLGVFLTITFRVAGRKGDPAPELTSSWPDFLIDLLMLMIAFIAYAMTLVGIVYLIGPKNIGRGA